VSGVRIKSWLEMLAPQSFGFPGENLLKTPGVFKLSEKEGASRFLEKIIAGIGISDLRWRRTR
jgi:hypothetical protein